MSKGFATGHDEHIGRSDRAGMPNEVKMTDYPPCRNYKGNVMDDTLGGIDEVNSRTEGKSSKYISNQK
ncbi:MAG: hypothetical protein LLG04_19010 [Parachlamydia sp.]|nr:hypothetical protein [Parachlamydia sp.]